MSPAKAIELIKSCRNHCNNAFYHPILCNNYILSKKRQFAKTIIFKTSEVFKYFAKKLKEIKDKPKNQLLFANKTYNSFDKLVIV